MREGIHPNYYQATVTCNCGNTFVTGSTKEDIHVEICSKCHPFYTGQQKAAQARGEKAEVGKSQPFLFSAQEITNEIIEYWRPGSYGRHYDAPQRQVFHCSAQAG